MIQINNYDLNQLLHLGFKGYCFDYPKRVEVLKWMQQNFNQDDYYVELGTYYFVRNPPAETMMLLLFQDHIKQTITQKKDILK
jgi:hypothetical protein